ncbi:hypothetical protein B0H11DRAFT_2345274 [Mycena galericulata]|nr:hypothetical protein B0H11DRAFT_2345274 [Mycena galericulata]
MAGHGTTGRSVGRRPNSSTGRKRDASPEASTAPEQPPGSQRPQRRNQGQGGHAEQLERAGVTASSTNNKRRKTAFQGSTDTPSNTFAPQQQKKPAKQRRPKSTTASVAPAPPTLASQNTASSPGTFTLPPGVNPPAIPPPAQNSGGLSRRTFTAPPGTVPHHLPPASFKNRALPPMNTHVPRAPPNPGAQTWPQHQAPPALRQMQSRQEGRHNGSQQVSSSQYEPTQDLYHQENPGANADGGNRMPEIYDVHHGPNDPVFLDNNQAHGYASRSYSGSQGAVRESSDEEDDEEQNDEDQDQDQDDVEIDEQSPDEDERIAQGYLQGSPHNGNPGPSVRSSNAGYSEDPVTNSADTNILEQHWERNRRPRIPDPNNMLERPSRGRSSRGRSSTGSRTNSRASGAPDQDPSPSATGTDDESLAAKRGRAKRNSRLQPAQDNAKGWHLRFYKECPNWTMVLTKAKRIYDSLLLSECGFPSTTNGSKMATECINEAINLFKTDNPDEDVEPDHFINKAMIKLITDDAASFRGDLKTYMRTLVVAGYSLINTKTVNPETDKKYTPEERKQYCIDQVEDWLQGGKWLNSGEGPDENLNHPVIEEGIRGFIYGEKSGRIGSEFPEIFGNKVPKASVALVGVAACCCLREWKTGEMKTIKFEGEAFRKDYEEILAAIDVVLDSENGDFYEEQLEAWAQEKSLGIKLNLSRSAT